RARGGADPRVRPGAAGWPRVAARSWLSAGGRRSGAEHLPQRRGEPLDLDRDVGPAEPLRRDEESLLLLVRAGQGRDLRAVVDVAAGSGDTVGPGVAEHGSGLGTQRPEVVEGEHEHRLAHELAVPVAVRVQREPGAGADGAP